MHTCMAESPATASGDAASASPEVIQPRRKVVSYTRKRGLLACDFCRHRKRRCDGKTPCSTCQEADADCSYPEPQVDRIESSNAATGGLLDRLKRVEQAIDQQSNTLESLSGLVSQVTQISQASSSRDPYQHQHQNQRDDLHASPHFSIDVDSVGSPNDTGSGLPPLLIPQRHETSTNRLMASPKVRALIGDYPDDYFYAIEATNQPFPGLSRLNLEIQGGIPTSLPLSFPPIERDVTDGLVACFYSNVHPLCPVLDQDALASMYENVLQNGLSPDIESAICLLVFALGSIASHSGPGLDDLDLNLGLQYFEAALPILMRQASWSFLPSILIPQALILGSVYFAYIARPLHSWRLVYLASTNLQLITSQPRTLTSSGSKLFSEEELRVSWSCFLIECDRLAELELPRSGIEVFADEMPLPACGHPPSTDMLYFLAEISIRRLLNRIHNSLYSRPSRLTSPRSQSQSLSQPTQLPQLLSICAELNRQLELWHESIPPLVRPSLKLGDAQPNDRARVLRIRYYATKHIIHRPFVLYAAEEMTERQRHHLELEETVLENCKVCVESCRLYLLNVNEMLAKRSQYTWTFSQSSLGALLVLSIASATPSLSHLVTDIGELQQLLVDRLTPWATAGSSFESIIWILNQIQRKQMIWNGRAGYR